MSHFDWKWCYRSVLVIMLSEGTGVDRKRAEEKDTLIFCEHDGGENKMSVKEFVYVREKTATLQSLQFLVMYILI